MRQTRMVCIKIHVDGAGGDNPGYAWVCDQTGEERFVSCLSTPTTKQNIWPSCRP